MRISMLIHKIHKTGLDEKVRFLSRQISRGGEIEKQTIIHGSGCGAADLYADPENIEPSAVIIVNTVNAQDGNTVNLQA